MLSRIHNKLGTAGLVVAIVALIAALAGTAFAAAKLNPTQKKEVTKIAKKFAGKNGKDGAPGAAGAKGATGAQGVPGTPGKTGETGATGATGATGKEGKKGATGATGATGFSGFTEFLPKGATETGAWAIANANSLVSASFNIPLKTKPKAIVLIGGSIALGKRVIPEGAVEESVCEGSATAPTAPEGVLCVYVDKMEEASFFGLEALSARYVSGATWFVGAGEGRAFGTWAVSGD